MDFNSTTNSGLCCRIAMICDAVSEVRWLNGEVEVLVVSGAEEVVSVVLDPSEVTGAATCWAKTEPHIASKATTLKERWANRVVGRVFIVIFNQPSGWACSPAQQ